MNIQILMEDMDVWNDMDDTPDVNMIDSNWIFNLKRFHDRMVEKSRECFDALHDGMVKKFKGFFYTRGDWKFEGTTIWKFLLPWCSDMLIDLCILLRYMLLLEVLLDLALQEHSSE